MHTSPDGMRAPDPAARADLHDILGVIDERQALDILALQPTVTQVEQAAVWARGEGDVLARDGRPLDAITARIVEILTAEEEQLEAGPGLPP